MYAVGRAYGLPYKMVTYDVASVRRCVCVCVCACMCRRNQTGNVAYCCVLHRCTRLDAHTVCPTRWWLSKQNRGYSIQSIESTDFKLYNKSMCFCLFDLVSRTGSITIVPNIKHNPMVGEDLEFLCLTSGRYPSRNPVWRYPDSSVIRSVDKGKP